MECLSKVAAKIPCTVKMEEKKLDNLEDVVGVNVSLLQITKSKQWCFNALYMRREASK